LKESNATKKWLCENFKKKDATKNMHVKDSQHFENRNSQKITRVFSI
jgi:hypothetical protein